MTDVLAAWNTCICCIKLYVCVCICLWVCVYLYAYAYGYGYGRCTCTCMFCMHMHIMCMWMRVYVSAYVYGYVYTHNFLCMYTCILGNKWIFQSNTKTPKYKIYSKSKSLAWNVFQKISTQIMSRTPEYEHLSNQYNGISLYELRKYLN